MCDSARVCAYTYAVCALRYWVVCMCGVFFVCVFVCVVLFFLLFCVCCACVFGWYVGVNMCVWCVVVL